tara:strand:+ start:2880 stop:3767 length:888 start_codon:yes stop_codon:yes gene_type:complete
MYQKASTNTAVDWVQSLLEANLDIPIDEPQFNIKCPFHVDSHASCAINTDKGVWICFAGCGEGSLYIFLKEYLDVTDAEIQRYLIPINNNTRIPLVDINEDIELPTVALPDNFQEAQFPQWIFDRGFTKEFLTAWGCGKNLYNDFIIPIRNYDSRVVGYVSRRQTTLPKYLYNTGLKKSQLLFGADKVEPSEFICITEGSLDTMWLHQHGYQAVALLGIHLSKKQFELCKTLPTKEFVLCLDNDEAGEIGKRRALQQLKQIAPTTYVKIPQEYKDVQDIRNKLILDSILSNRYTW